MTKQKKVLFFIPDFPVVTQTFIELEVAALAKLGNIDVNVFSLKKGDGTLSDILINKVFYKRLNFGDFFGILYILIFRFSLVVKAYSQLKNLKSSLFNKLFFFFKTLGYAYYIKKLNPNHIHAHFLSDSSTMGFIIAIVLDLPFSISSHAKDVFVNSQLVKEKAIYSKFISVCNYYAWQEVVNLAGEENKEKILLQHHGSDLSVLQKNINIQRNNEVPVILNVGRFEEKKGQKYLIEASYVLKNQGIKHKIKIFGGGSLFDNLKSKIKEFDVSDTVEIYGEGRGTPYKIVIQEMQNADIYTLPSIKSSNGDVEGIPNTLVEAAYYKLPLVATPTGSITEIVIDSQTGILVKENDAQSLAEALKTLVNNKELRIKYGENGHNLVLEKFDMSKNILNLERQLLLNL